MTTEAIGVDGGRRRGLELTLVVFALLFTVGAYIAAGLGLNGKVPSGVVPYGIGLGVMFLGAHLVVRLVAPHADPLFVPVAALLNGLGLVLIHRLDLSPSQHHAKDATHQLEWTAIGILLFVAVLLVVRDHRWLQRYMYTAMVAGIVLLLVPSVLPASHSAINGSKVWIRFGGFSFQPSELAKILLEIFFAGYLVAKRDLLSLAGRRVAGVDLPRARDLGPILLAWAASVAVLVRENDLGTSLLFFGIFVAVLYIATGRLSWLIIGVTLFVVGAFAAYQLFAHVRVRFDIWLHPFQHAQTTGYQLVQALFGFADGGLLGTGLGRGHPGLVPFAKTDFIAATIGEELGLAGLMAVLVLYILFVGRGLRAAVAVRDPFGKLLAAALSIGVALQVFVQVGGVTRLIPLTGLTLPFVSYGGSSLVSNWVIVALLVRISDAARRQPPAPVRPAPGPPGFSTSAADEATTQVVRR